MPEPGSSRGARIVTRGRSSASANAASTASPRPPSGQWSSAVTIRPPVASAAARNVSTSIGLTEYASITRTATPSPSSSAAALSASDTVIPAATIATASSSDERTTLEPPTGKSSSAP